MDRKRQALLITAHPDAASLTCAAAAAAQSAVEAAGLVCVRRDLYRDGESVDLQALDLSEYRRKTSFLPLVQEFEGLVAASQLLIFCYPDWWGQMPGILKNWLDRVFRSGTAYGQREDAAGNRVHVPLLADKLACVYCTGDEEGPSPQEGIWKESICSYTGLKLEAFSLLQAVRGSTARERKAWLADVGRSAGDAAAKIILQEPPESR